MKSRHSFPRPSARGSDPFLDLRSDFNSLIDQFARGFAMPADPDTAGSMVPKVDIAETEKGLEMQAELPGVRKEDIELGLDDGILTLKASHSSEKDEEDKNRKFHLVERSRGTYMRRFTLPFEADQDGIDAQFENGVLKVSIPRAAESEKPLRKIEVKSSA